MCVCVKYGWVDWFGDWTGGLKSISPNYDQSASCILRRMMLVPSNFLPPGHFTLPVPGSYLPFSPSSPRFHRPVRSYQAVPTFSPFFCLLCPYAFFFFLVLCVLATRTLCTVVVGLLLASFSSPHSLVSISRLRHSPSCGRPRSPPRPQPIPLCGAAPRRAIDSGPAILLWANGRLRPRRSSRLLLGFARVGETGVGPLSGPRSSRRARDLTMRPCASADDDFLLKEYKTTEISVRSC
jgi:hypothetical protein